MAVTQTDMVLAHLLKGKPITQLGALAGYGIFRLSARIRELRLAGHPIRTVYITDKRTKKTFAQYRLVKA